MTEPVGKLSVMWFIDSSVNYIGRMLLLLWHESHCHTIRPFDTN